MMPNLWKQTLLVAALTAVTSIIFYLFLDRAIILWIHHNWHHTWLFTFGKGLSSFVKGTDIKIALACCFIVILVGDGGRKSLWAQYLGFMAISVCIAIILGDGVKYLLARYRPIMLLEHNLYGFHFLSSEWALNSTPSGHTLRAFSLCTAASLVARRFTWFFMAIAAMIGASRVVVTDHYPSDVFFGAFIGIFVACWTYRYFFFPGDQGKKNHD